MGRRDFLFSAFRIGPAVSGRGLCDIIIIKKISAAEYDCLATILLAWEKKGGNDGNRPHIYRTLIRLIHCLIVRHWVTSKVEIMQGQIADNYGKISYAPFALFYLVLSY